MVTVRQPRFRDRLGAADAFGDILAGHLEMHAAGMGPFRLMDGEEAQHLCKDFVDVPGLVAAGRFDGVAVHRIASPHHLASLALHRPNQGRKPRLHLVRAHAANEGQPAGFILGA